MRDCKQGLLELICGANVIITSKTFLARALGREIQSLNTNTLASVLASASVP